MRIARKFLGTYRGFLVLLCFTYLGMVFIIHGKLEFAQQEWTKHKVSKSEKNFLEFLNFTNFSAHSLVDNKPVFKKVEKVMPVTSRGIKFQSGSSVSCLKSSDSMQMRWQILAQQNAFVYSAYFDDRKKKKFIRIMAILRRNLKNSSHVTCHFSKPKENVTAEIYEMCENHNKPFGGFIFSCAIPAYYTEVCNISVSIVIKSTQFVQQGSVALPIISIAKPFKKKYAICVPPLFGNISAQQLVEFMELSQLIGSDFFFFYDYKLSENARRVINYYVEKNVAVLYPWNLPKITRDSSIWYNGQLIAHNDCVYRAMSMAEMLAINDIDEFIVPQKTTSWEHSILPLKSNISAGFAFNSAFFDPRNGISHPSGMLTMGNTARTKKFSTIRTKVMVVPQKIFEVGIHHVSKPNEEVYVVKKVETNVAFLHHYRTCISNYGMKCEEMMTDRNIFRFFDKLQERFVKVLIDLNIINRTIS